MDCTCKAAAVFDSDVLFAKPRGLRRPRSVLIEQANRPTLRRAYKMSLFSLCKFVGTRLITFEFNRGTRIIVLVSSTRLELDGDIEQHGVFAQDFPEGRVQIATSSFWAVLLLYKNVTCLKRELNDPQKGLNGITNDSDSCRKAVVFSLTYYAASLTFRDMDADVSRNNIQGNCIPYTYFVESEERNFIKAEQNLLQSFCRYR
jgi:hypothetical protein